MVGDCDGKMHPPVVPERFSWRPSAYFFPRDYPEGDHHKVLRQSHLVHYRPASRCTFQGESEVGEEAVGMDRGGLTLEGHEGCHSDSLHVERSRSEVL